MKNFTAIDFETASGYRNSICQVGLVQVEEGIITHSLNLLVQPPNNYYWSDFIDIHGITPAMTKNEPTFDQIWHLVAPFIEGKNVVAHNGFSFDFPVLDKTLFHYGLTIPAYNKYCTYKIYRSNLADLCQEHNIPLNHHDALSDAQACAKLWLRYLGNL
ncbi:MAG TPA: exonuclease [Flavobacterium sp.]|nr:exonuclease [Flavobacterium sp.]